MSRTLPSENAESVSPLTADELARLRARLAVRRPLHWDEAMRLIDALEAAWAARDAGPRARPC